MASKETYKQQFSKQNQWIRDNREKLSLVLPKGTKAKWKARAEEQGKSLTQYIYDKIEEGI